MTRPKKIFTAFALVFLLFLIYIVYDISSRTTFPGAGPSGPEPASAPGDTVREDTLP